MPSLFRHPVARFVTLTALVGSLADWVLFATLVVTVDRLVGGGPWATALVLLARIAPGVVLAPVAARRVDRLDVRTTLVRHEAVRIAAVTALAAAFLLHAVPLVLVALVVLEFAAAMQAAARESTTSRYVPPAAFTAVNTATAVLGYGLLPVGAFAVARLGASTGWLVALAGYATLLGAYALGLRLPEMVPDVASHDPAAPVDPDGDGGWRRVTFAAALGVVPAVAVFALGPSFAGAWLGDHVHTAPLYAVVLLGGAVGFALANLRRLRADLAMLVAATGLALAALGAWVPGLLLLGVGAGAAYLDLQTRLQHTASTPSEFAAAFAVLKGASAAAVAGAPLLASIAPLPWVLVAGGGSALIGATVASPAPTRVAQRGVRGVLRLVARAVLRLEVVGADDRVPGPAVVVSNHPHWLDGVVALLADDTLRPIARRQDHRGARLGIWAADAVVTTRPADPTADDPTVPRRPAFAEATTHLSGGGRIWLAPEGGAHTGRRLRPLRSGAVRMAHLADAPVQPLGIRWADGHRGPTLARWRPWRRRVVRVTWGQAVATTGDVATDSAHVAIALAAVTGMGLPDGVELTVAA